MQLYNLFELDIYNNYVEKKYGEINEKNKEKATKHIKEILKIVELCFLEMEKDLKKYLGDSFNAIETDAFRCENTFKKKPPTLLIEVKTIIDGIWLQYCSHSHFKPITNCYLWYVSEMLIEEDLIYYEDKKDLEFNSYSYSVTDIRRCNLCKYSINGKCTSASKIENSNANLIEGNHHCRSFSLDKKHKILKDAINLIEIQELKRSIILKLNEKTNRSLLKEYTDRIERRLKQHKGE